MKGITNYIFSYCKKRKKEILHRLYHRNIWIQSLETLGSYINHWLVQLETNKKRTCNNCIRLAPAYHTKRFFLLYDLWCNNNCFNILSLHRQSDIHTTPPHTRIHVLETLRKTNTFYLVIKASFGGTNTRKILGKNWQMEKFVLPWQILQNHKQKRCILHRDSFL